LLDSTLVEAITTLGFIQSNFDYNWKKAKLTLEKAIALNPQYAYAHIYYGNLLQFTGEDTERGIEEIKKARDLDPLSASIKYVLGRNYYFAGKYDLAEEQLRKAIGINSKFFLAKGTLSWVLLAQKKYPEAIELIKQVPAKLISKTDMPQGTLLSYAYAISGNIPAAKAALEKTIKENTYGGHTLLARTYVGLNDFNMALTELEKALVDKEIYLYFLKVDPMFNPIRNEPKFKELLKKINFE
jgi:serine/threonine-protein kinase